jgi:hypothetical protein
MGVPQGFDNDDSQGQWYAHSLVLQQYQEELATNQKEIKMSLIVKESGGGGDYKPAPAGAHVARCFRIVDLGTQETTFKGETKHQHQILVTWELPTNLMTEGESNGKPYTVNQRFTASLSEKATLRKVLESWRGRKFTPAELAGFDLANILGKPCLLNVVHTDKGERVYANIASVMQVPGGMVVPPQANPSLFFSLSAFDAAALESLPDALKEKIKTAPEYQAAVRGEHNQVKADDGSIDTLDDDIPF